MPQAIPIIGTFVGMKVGEVFAWSAFSTALFSTAIATGTSMIVANNYDVEGQTVDDDSGLLATKQANDAPLPVVYGSRRVGGTLVFIESAGTDNEYLYMIVALCEGEVSAINTVYLDGVDSTDSRFTGDVRITKHTGADNQTVDLNFATEIPASWTANHRLRGVAYLAIRLTYNPDVFKKVPVVTADVDGKLVYDPRDTNTKHSSNPALCIRDYITNTRYGMGIDESIVDDTYISSEANYCDEDVTMDGVTQDRYTCDGVVDTSYRCIDNLKGLLTSCRGSMIYTGGLYRLLLDKITTPSSFGFDESNITGNWKISPGGRRDKLNRVIAHFYNPDREWRSDLHPIDSPTYRGYDNGLLLKADIDLPHTANYLTAGQIATIEMNQSRESIKVSFSALMAGMRAEVGDVVPITHSTPGWSGKEFRVRSITLKNNYEVTVVVQEYSDDVYDYTSVSDTDTVPDTNLPDPFSVLGPSSIDTLTNVTAGNGNNFASGVIRIVFTIPSTTPDYDYTEIWISTDDSTYYHVANDSDGDIYIDGLGVYWDYGQTVYVKLRNVNTAGIREAMPGTATDSVTINANVKIAGFFASDLYFWGGDANIGSALTQLVMGPMSGTPAIKLGPSANAITLTNASSYTGFYTDGAGDTRFGGPEGSIKWATDVLEVLGTLNIKAGNSLKLEGHDTNPGEIIFTGSGGSGYSILMGMDAGGDFFSIHPSVGNVQGLMIGDWGVYSYGFSIIGMFSTWAIGFEAKMDADNRSALTLTRTIPGGVVMIDMEIEDEGYDHSLSFWNDASSKAVFGPGSDPVDLANSGSPFRDLYIENIYGDGDITIAGDLTANNVFDPEYAEIYDSSYGTITVSSAGIPYKNTQFDSNGPDSGATAVYTSAHNLINRSGDYEIMFECSAYAGASALIDFTIEKNSGATTLVTKALVLDTNYKDVSLGGIFSVSSGDTIEQWVENTLSTQDVTVAFSRLSVKLIKPA